MNLKCLDNKVNKIMILKISHNKNYKKKQQILN